MAVAKKDKYANILNVQVTMSAANTLTFEEIDIGLNIFDKVGILLHRFECLVSNATWVNMEAVSDAFEIALVADNSITSLTFDNRAVIDNLKVAGLDSGTAASFVTHDEPLKHDYSSLPGGGMLIAPKPLYLAMDSIGFASAGYASARLYFTIIELKPEEYFELLESRRYFG